MPNFKHHIFSGIMLFPVYYLIFSIIYNIIFGNYPRFENNELIFAFLFFIFGADLPDVDHDLSIINKIFRILTVIFTVFYIYEYEYLFRDIIAVNDILLYNFIILYIGIILGYSLGIIFNSLTRHRGAWHKFHTGIIIGIIIYFVNIKYYMIVRIFYSLALVTGFYVHITMDKYIKLKK